MHPQTMTRPTPSALWICGGIGIAGALFAVLADVLSWFLAEGYSPVGQTISTLALGRASWLIDLGLWAFALACLVTGMAMLMLDLRTGFWRIASLAIMAAGLCAAVIAPVNGYAGQRNLGANLHMWSVFALYLLFAVAALAAVPGLRGLNDSVARYSRLAGWAWILLGPIYYLWFPSGWAGAFERVLALLMVVWLVVIGQLLHRKGRQLARDA